MAYIRQGFQDGEVLTANNLTNIEQGVIDLEPLIGTTADTTPEDVMNAVQSGRQIAITHTDSAYGKVVFSSFDYAEGFGAVMAAIIAFYGGESFAIELVGTRQSGVWSLLINPIPRATGQLINDSGFLNTDEVNALIDTKLGVIENGSY